MKKYNLLDHKLKLDAYKLQSAFRQIQNTTDQIGSVSVCWSSGNKQTAAIQIVVDMQHETLRLVYNADKVPHNDTYRLHRMYSNMIPNSYHWQFICPSTHKVCSKLYLHDGTFMSRYAIPNAMYEQQIESAQTRKDKLNTIIRYWNIRDKEYPRWKKTHYKGRETRRHKRWERIIDRAAQKYLIAYNIPIHNMR